jgi:hypothetical protein
MSGVLNWDPAGAGIVHRAACRRLHAAVLDLAVAGRRAGPGPGAPGVCRLSGAGSVSADFVCLVIAGSQPTIERVDWEHRRSARRNRRVAWQVHFAYQSPLRSRAAVLTLDPCAIGSPFFSAVRDGTQAQSSRYRISASADRRPRHGTARRAPCEPDADANPLTTLPVTACASSSSRAARSPSCPSTTSADRP